MEGNSNRVVDLYQGQQRVLGLFKGEMLVYGAGCAVTMECPHTDGAAWRQEFYSELTKVITADEGYLIIGVQVMMAGEDVTQDVVDADSDDLTDGVASVSVNIPHILGDITISTRVMRALEINGVNVTTCDPQVGDILLFDENGDKVWVKGDSDITSALVPEGWTLTSYAFHRDGNKVKVMDKADTTEPWLACWQYAITAITSTNITIKLRMSNNYGAYTDVPVTLASTDINQANATAISDAVAAKATEVGDTNAWWAWYDEDNDRIVVQTDVCANYQQYNVSGTGCSIALCVWEDMPAHNSYYKKNGLSTNTRGMMNIAIAVSYWSTNGRTPTAAEPLHVGGNDNPVTRAAFEQSEYCAAIREEYGTYENYMAEDFGIMYPQNYGVFSLIDAKEMTRRYANSVAPTKAGGTLYKFPALHYGTTVGYEADDLETGKWWLSDVTDGVEFMADATLAKVAAAQTKMGTSVLANTAYRWFGRRCDANSSWIFSGASGALSANSVYGRGRVRAVTLLEI